MLVDYELDNNQLDNAIGLFSECLLNCYHVPLWLSYMRFIKMVCIQYLFYCLIKAKYPSSGHNLLFRVVVRVDKAEESPQTMKLYRILISGADAVRTKQQNS
jgi:hypothetical protein